MGNDNLTDQLTEELLSLGADMVGFGDLCDLPADVRNEFPIGVSVVVRYPNEVIQGIADLPTQEYKEWYELLNDRLDMLVTKGAELLQTSGYRAQAQTRSVVGFGEDGNNTVLPHKTVATRAGIGWIGKNALLTTKEHGSMVRISSILTDAPLRLDEPINKSYCGTCTTCADECPAEAIHGVTWNPSVKRDELVDPVICREVAQARSKQGFGGGHTICGKCIEVCPFTRKAWGS